MMYMLLLSSLCNVLSCCYVTLLQYKWCYMLFISLFLSKEIPVKTNKLLSGCQIRLPKIGYYKLKF